MITKADAILNPTADIKKKPNIKEIWNNSEIRNIINRFIKKVNLINEEEVLLICNYVAYYDPTVERDYVKETLLLNAVEVLKCRGEDFVKISLQNFIH